MDLPEPKHTQILTIWFGYLVFVIYGSFVPLEFKQIPIHQAWAAFQQIPMLILGVESRADWIANGVLYVPVGFLTAQLWIQKSHKAWQIPLLFLSALFSFALAFGIEFTQLFFPPRTVSVNDILAECIGSFIGLILAIRYSEWFGTFLHAVLSNPRRLASHLTEAYLVGYVAFCLFPYDILLSGAELEQKLHGTNWGWLLAGDSEGTFLVILKLLSEVVLTIPFGLFLGYKTERKSATLKQAAWSGILLGGFIEITQLFSATGVSQGLSVLTRVAGVCGGLVLWNSRSSWPPDGLDIFVRRYKIPLVVTYFLVLLQVNGWSSHVWNSADYAVSQLDELHFMPFYYHYFTTEAKALYSLAGVCLMYLPIGLMTWLNQRAPFLAFFYAFLVSGIFEVGKLFLQGLHPDPTNILVAGCASWGVAHLVGQLSNAVFCPKKDEAQVGQFLTQQPTDKTILPSPKLAGHWQASVLMYPSLAFATYWAATFPVQPAWLSLFFFISAVTIWFRPALIVVIIPATLPILDLAQWSGRFFFDEFDVLVLICLSIGYTRLPPIKTKFRHIDTPFVLAISLLATSIAIAAIRGLIPWQIPDANAFTNYYSQFNALRIAKGALWAFLLYGLFRRIAFSGQNVGRMFAFGMATGIAGTLLVVIWERFTFSGLLNFSDVYRITALFSQMHVGGADIETYLVMGVPFLVMLIFAKVPFWARITSVLLLLGGAYGVMVTFSRVGYAGFGVAFTIAVIASIKGNSTHKPAAFLKRLAASLILLMAILSVVMPIYYNQFAQERIALVGADLNTRQKHWEDALSIRDSGWATEILGMGVGRYPDTHFWRSAETKAAPYWLGTEPENTFLRLGAGNPTYIEQFVSLQAGYSYAVDLNVRSTQRDSQLTLSICEKWLLTSARCNSEVVNFDGNGTWQPVQIRFQTSDLGQGPWYASRPVKFSLYNTSSSVTLELDNIRMSSVADDNLIVNGDFTQKFDHWFFSVDNDLPWHVWSLPIQVLFDQGWFGVAAFGFFVLLGLYRAGRKAWQGDVEAGVVFAATTSFLVIGTLDSLVDSPRLVLLFLLGMWFCWRGQDGPHQRRGNEA